MKSINSRTTVFTDTANEALKAIWVRQWQKGFVLCSIYLCCMLICMFYVSYESDIYGSLTVSGHAKCKALLQSAVLTTIAIDSIDWTAFATWTLIRHWTWLTPTEKPLCIWYRQYLHPFHWKTPAYTASIYTRKPKHKLLYNIYIQSIGKSST